MKVRLPTPLTAAQKKAATKEIDLQIAESMKQLNVDLCAMFLYVMHIRCGHGKKRLQDDWKVFQPILDELIKRYQFDETDRTWICSRKLKDIGIDCEELCKDTKPLLSYVIND